MSAPPPDSRRADPGTPEPVTRVIAHRGASSAARENTVAAFELAVEMRADGIELDVRRTADGALVVHHDAVVEGRGPIAELAAADLPDHVPSLTAALLACRGAWVNIEIKNSPDEPGHDPGPSLAADTLACLAAIDLPVPSRPPVPGQVWLVSSFHRATLQHVRRLDPAMPTALLVDTITDEVVAACLDDGHPFVHPWVGHLRAEHIEMLQAARPPLGCNTWTCNDATTMVELVRWGVDGIVTDQPDLARRTLDSLADAALDTAADLT